MKYDIVFVTFNSSKWIKKCLNSIVNTDYNLKQLSLIIVDNNSNDDTVHILEEHKQRLHGLFADFIIIKSRRNLGFGKGNNIGAQNGASPFIFFLNIDTEIEKDAFLNIDKYIEESSNDVAMWELRQIPYEHPKFYNPITLETSWASGAAFLIRRNIFEKVGGFDKAIFMYAEDVDLSWNVRTHGFRIKYMPNAIVNHYSYDRAGQIKPGQYLNSLANNILLRYKYGSFKEIIKAFTMLIGLLTRQGPFLYSRSRLIWHIVVVHASVPGKLIRRLLKSRPKSGFKAKFLGWDYEIIRDGAFIHIKRVLEGPKVSIIVRTCGRPSVLRETLISIRNQTYKNIEVVIVEDGKNLSEKMIKNDFSDINILYTATDDKVGRCKAGNIAMALATGKYLNFLDDDDVFFADHIETLVRCFEENPNFKIAYSLTFETAIEVHSKEPYIYEEKMHSCIYRQDFNRLLIFHHNYLPIQAVMFEKSVFDELGGFDENIDVLEDWDLWVRYATKYDFKHVAKTTSMYRVPFCNLQRNSRQKALDEALDYVVKKYNREYAFNGSIGELRDDFQKALDSYSFKISNQVMASLQNKVPIIVKLMFYVKNFLKRRLS